ncbi:MAG: 5'-deoxynucleotidase [Butyribacter sp.]|nr:5'-deoxynucleotidase [bacterium]MDY3853830.1 5'-deoxynucleotidase [Butyribacter sp.]
MSDSNNHTKDHSFFAMLARMKYIERWALMRNSVSENISEHSLEVAIVAHALALLGNKRLGKNYNPEHVAMLGIYHDCTEIITGDMPTPIKYENPDIQSAYKQIEKEAAYRLLNKLPDDLRKEYEPYFIEQPQDKEAHILVKAADKISALIKCIEEEKTGNQEFGSAKQTIAQSIKQLHCPEADIFTEEFLPLYQMTLDELS